MDYYNHRCYGPRSTVSDQNSGGGAVRLSAAVAAAALALGTLGPQASAAPFDVAEVFFELNNTDGDLGIHAKIDGEDWEELEIRSPAPDDDVILEVEADGILAEQGLTEIAFESAEPTFDEFSPEEFFDRFPEGMYTVSAETLDGPKLKTKTRVTHTMPAPPGGITVSGTPVDPASVDCDSEELPEVTAPVTIAWAEVTMSHPDPAGGGAGVQPPIAVTINNYEVVLEVETDGGFESVFSVVLPPDETSMTVPAEFLALGDEFKFEILAREESFNQTAVESCFVLAE